VKAATLTLRREDLVSANACAEWLAFFDQVCTLRGEDRAPWVRRDGVSRRDPSRLRIELTPLAQVWLSLPLSASSGVAWVWLRERNLVGSVFARGANLRGADLRGADLRGANLYGANLYGADRWSDDAPLAGWSVRNDALVRATEVRS